MMGFTSSFLRWMGQAALLGVGLALVLALIVLSALVAPTIALAGILPAPGKKVGRSHAGRRFGADGALRADLSRDDPRVSKKGGDRMG